MKMFGKKNAIATEQVDIGGILTSQSQAAAPVVRPVFIEFTGATGSVDDDGFLRNYVPRDKITINLARISGFYDHTILVEGRKIRVMDSYSQIALKVLEAMKG